MLSHQLAISVAIVWPVLEGQALTVIFTEVHAFEDGHVDLEAIVDDVLIYTLPDIIGAFESYNLV